MADMYGQQQQTPIQAAGQRRMQRQPGMQYAGGSPQRPGGGVRTTMPITTPPPGAYSQVQPHSWPSAAVAQTQQQPVTPEARQQAQGEIDRLNQASGTDPQAALRRTAGGGNPNSPANDPWNYNTYQKNVMAQPGRPFDAAQDTHWSNGGPGNPFTTQGQAGQQPAPQPSAYTQPSQPAQTTPGAGERPTSTGMSNDQFLAGGGQSQLIAAAQRRRQMVEQDLPGVKEQSMQFAANNGVVGSGTPLQVYNNLAQKALGDYERDAMNFDIAGAQDRSQREQTVQGQGFQAGESSATRQLQRDMPGIAGAQDRLNIAAQGDQSIRGIGAQGDQNVRSIGAQGEQTRQNVGAEGEQQRQNIHAGAAAQQGTMGFQQGLEAQQQRGAQLGLSGPQALKQFESSPEFQALPPEQKLALTGSAYQSMYESGRLNHQEEYAAAQAQIQQRYASSYGDGQRAAGTAWGDEVAQGLLKSDPLAYWAFQAGRGQADLGLRSADMIG